MLSLTTRVDKRGFWYLIEGEKDCSFSCSYIVIGTGGRQGSGELQATTGANGGRWEHVEIGFPVMHVGITDLQVLDGTPNSSLAQSSRPPAEGLSRRQAIRTLASTLLTGGALMMFPSSLSASFNPYGAEAESFFKPY